jgi:predicted NBD/HSP70 family sugar kinase
VRKIDLSDFKTADHRILRDINEVIVLNVIRERQPIPRVSIAEITGLEEGTISRIVHRFLQQGLVYESGVGTSTPAGGRKPRFLHINPSKRCAIGVDVGSTETLLALSDLNGHLHRVKRIPNNRHPVQLLGTVAEQVLDLYKQASPRSELGGVGVSLVGLVDHETGTVCESQILGWGKRVEVGNILKAKLGGVSLYFDNGARLSALGEIWFGTTHLSGFRNVVFIEVSEGIGTGIVVNGQLYRGAHNGAGEFGHVCVDSAGPKCACGSRGCLEAFASDVATVERFLSKSEVKPNGGRSENSRIDMAAIVDLVRKGRAEALEALRETAHYLGLGLAPIIYGLNPEAIVIGGALAEAWDLVEPDIRTACAQRVSPLLLENTKIFPSTIHVRPSLMGAIALVLAQSFAAPKTV